MRISVKRKQYFSIVVKEQNFGEVEQFNYLDSVIETDRRCAKGIKVHDR